MRLSKTAIAAAAVSLNAGVVSAAAASFCADTDVCFEWGVPEVSAKAGSGNVYFQLKAPTSYQWIGLGIGGSMPNSNMFIMYQDGKGNVTLSTRPGAQHVMPTYKARSDVELLAGSGVVNGNMIANVKCSQCTDIDLSGSTGWIAAWKSGSALDSTSPSQTITQHDDTNQFNVDMSQASISSDSNPFVSSSPSSGGSSSGGSGSGSGSGNGGSSGSGGNSSSGGNSPGAVTVTASSGPSTQTLISAHGILMSIVFVVLYPIGSLLMPLLGKWYIHATWQIISWLGMWAGLALGVVSAKRLDIFFDQAHTRMGTIVVALLAIQPIFGWLHHAHYVKTQSRGAFSYIHIWYGRSLLIVGIVNGGLGLQLANESNRFIIAYSVVAGVVALLYLATAAVKAFKPKRSQPKNL